jgi:hypothetical protein
MPILTKLRRILRFRTYGAGRKDSRGLNGFHEAADGAFQRINPHCSGQDEFPLK